MTKKFELEIDEVEAYIIEKTDGKLNKGIIKAVMSYLHRISCYREEEKTFSFKIALGYEQPSQMEAPSFFPIKTISLSTDENNEINVKKAIHDVAIFCEKGSDLYIYQKKEGDNTSIICGTYFTELAKTGYLDDLIIANKGMVIESENNNFIVLKSKGEYGVDTAWINFSLLKLGTPSGYPTRESDECRYWDGIFRTVRKNVHGTICLIVKPDWDAAGDESFTKPPEIVSTKIDISYDPKQPDQKKNCIDIFLSMLDYDGITILDTDGHVKSYHNFCKNTEGNGSLLGGARHRAYEFLKGRNNPAYVGIYFQSHEGNAEYYDFSAPEEHRSKKWFDSKVMSYGTDNDCARDVLAYMRGEYAQTRKDQSTFFGDAAGVVRDFFNIICKLKTAHDGANNFYKEAEPARELQTFFDSNKVVINEALKKYPYLKRKFIDVLILCYVGNSYGYSYTARPYIEDIMKKISYEIYMDYFRNKYYISYDILSALVNQDQEWHDASILISGTAPTEEERINFLSDICDISKNSYDMRRAVNYFNSEHPEKVME